MQHQYVILQLLFSAIHSFHLFINSSTPERYESNFTGLFFKLILLIDVLSNICAMGLRECYKASGIISLHSFR